ncbi:RuBisCO large subunit C-terminal-like domain-containing protein [Faecalicatena contorta]|uniref:2,3-diketo-5-methylthiopentyl-1-phosphate enolase n=1 Tax=Faecalicatena contorta TaxID=39482 RepID=A0A315ZSI4_9FIRM|nr:RuBisCO large subunit C-terminal-like domain-containing protein [Faecalicatena contorta]PWJ47694.1 2,3-diketo-5-methylthiopentyl-1-phosphate enolase [Faecalicatena contorta]SUQ15887.1 2,3-diketo-5-methylthiopentyl-1-phosphate enolase [Faecalicatena contorta]
MNSDTLFALNENMQDKEYCIVSYYVELPYHVDPYEKAKNMAVGQTIGTWLPVPGITEEMRRHHMGKIINVFDLSPDDLVEVEETNWKNYIFQIAYPVVNFENSIPLLLTTILGNDASTSVKAKIIDLSIPEELAHQFPGPAYGIEGIRRLCGVEERPMLLNMIKPCIGFSPEEGAKIFYETALGGIDFIKDDELLGNPAFCPLKERVREYTRAAEVAFEITGKKTIYIPNITDHIDRLLENAKNAVEAGAEVLMVNFSAVGLGALQMLREHISTPIMGHYAGTGPFYEGARSGIASNIILGKFPRMLGADIVMMNTPYGGYPLKKTKYIRTAHELTLPIYGIKPTLPSCGGGVNPGIVHQLVQDLGTDIMLAPGGAIQGHPMGARAGVKAMLDAVDAEMSGKTLEEAAADSPELEDSKGMWTK